MMVHKYLHGLGLRQQPRHILSACQIVKIHTYNGVRLSDQGLGPAPVLRKDQNIICPGEEMKIIRKNAWNDHGYAFHAAGERRLYP